MSSSTTSNDNNSSSSSTLNSYLTQASGTLQSTLGNLTGSTSDQIQGNAKQDRAQTENTLSHTVGKVGPYTISGSGTLTKDDPDRSRGEWNQTFGAAKEAFGGLVGAEGLKADGIRQNREGKEQEARGQVNDFGKGVGDRVAGAVGGVVASLTGDQNAQDEFRRLHDVGKTMQRSAETDVQRKQQ